MENSPPEKLPAELRNEIYRLVVSADKPLTVCAQSPGYHKAIQPPITRVCRQIRDESLGVFYHCNDFVFEVVSAECWGDPECDITDRSCEIERWLECSTEKNRAAIRNLLIVCGEYSDCCLDGDSEWQDLAEILLGYGYGGKGEQKNKFKCTIHVHLVFQYWGSLMRVMRRAGTDPEAYSLEQVAKSTKLFEDLGFDVQVTSETVNDR
ncbi:unnamed protein product [Cercospora beticola]|nr:unnamed protein product [Cercospora beticola]